MANPIDIPTAQPAPAGAPPAAGRGLGGSTGDGLVADRAAATFDQVAEKYKDVVTSFSDDALGILGYSLKTAADMAILGIADTIIKPLKEVLTSAEELGVQTIEIASVIEGISGLNAEAISSGKFGVDTVAEQMSRNAFKAVNDIADAEIQLANGTKVALAAFGDASDFLSSYSESALRDSRLFRAATEGTTKEMLEMTRLAQRNLGLSSQQINKILQYELSETGKISGEFLMNYQKTAIATAQATGQPIEQVTKDLNAMLNNFNTFGMMTIDQMSALSVTVSKLGMNISDVTSLANNFQSFDRAAATMSNLAASTGATLDTLELFELANTDQEAFLLSLRDQLESQGVEFEEMNFIQQKNIAQAFGVDPLIMKRILSDNFDDIESAQEEIAAKKEKLGDEETKSLVASMKRLDDVTAEDLTKRLAGMKSATLEYATSIERAYSASTRITADIIDAAGEQLDSYRSKIELYRGALDKFSEKTLGSPAAAVPEPDAARAPAVPQLVPVEGTVSAPAPVAVPVAPAAPVPAPATSESGTAPAPAAAPSPSPSPAAPAQSTEYRHIVELNLGPGLTAEVARDLTNGVSVGGTTLQFVVRGSTDADGVRQ